jgi:hypothetical protein
MTKDLQTRREELEQKYRRVFDAHCVKYSKYIAKEDEYRLSARKTMVLYNELFDVALELGDPIPMWF